MKQLNLLKTLFLLCALMVGSSSAWADTKTEGFETKATSTSYNSTVNISTAESDCGIAWTIYYGCVSTNDKISGTRSAQMRWYSSATTNYPYIKSTTAVDGLTNISLKARTSDLNVKMDVCYSANGETWTIGKTHTFKATGVGEAVSLDIPSGNKYVKFGVSSSSTAPESGNYKLIVDDVVFTYSSSLDIPTWSVDPASATVNIGGTTDLQLDTNYDGTLSFESNNTSIATVAYNSGTKVITVTGVSAGSTTITATGAATAKYQAITKNISVTVVHPEYANNFMDEITKLGYGFFGLTADKGSDPKYAQPNVASTSKTDINGVTLEFAQGDAKATYVRYDEKYTRFYQKNTLTVTAPTGSTIRKIVFTEPATDKGWSGSMDADNGDYMESIKTWYATTEDVTSVVFTNDATKRIGGMEVYLYRTSVPAVISTAEYATFNCGNALDFSTTGITAYTATAGAKSVTLNEIAGGKVPANTPVVLYKASADGTAINVPVIASAPAVGDNDLHVSTGTDVADMYVLSKKGGVVGFYKWNGTTDLSAGKVYLQATTTAPEFLGFGDATGIEAVKAQANDSQVVYNLAGQRVAQPTKGLYIVNGKKVIIK